MLRRMLSSRWIRRIGRPYGADVPNNGEDPKDDDGVIGPVLSSDGVVVSAGVAAAPRNAPDRGPTVSPDGVVVSPGDPAAPTSTAVALADAPTLREKPAFPEENVVLERLAELTEKLNDPCAAAVAVFVAPPREHTE